MIPRILLFAKYYQVANIYVFVSSLVIVLVKWRTHWSTHATFSEQLFKCGKTYEYARGKYLFTSTCDIYGQQSRMASIYVFIKHCWMARHARLKQPHYTIGYSTNIRYSFVTYSANIKECVEPALNYCSRVRNLK